MRTRAYGSETQSDEVNIVDGPKLVMDQETQEQIDNEASDLLPAALLARLPPVQFCRNREWIL